MSDPERTLVRMTFFLVSCLTLLAIVNGFSMGDMRDELDRCVESTDE